MADFTQERTIAPHAHFMNLVQVGAYYERESDWFIEGTTRLLGSAWNGGLE
jgi:hypothetical protein